MADLFSLFIAEENFLAAYKRVAAKGSRGGVDRVSVEEFGRNLNRHLNAIRHAIESGRYMPEAVEAVAIPKFNQANEWRELGLPTVADKVVQAALLQVVEPRAEKIFMDSSYAYRPGKGHFKAIRRVEHYLHNRKCCWVAAQDIDNFFDTLDHQRLLAEFARLVDTDERLLHLVALWCRNGIVARDGRWKNVEAGVRQGQVISPLLANLYLHELDRFSEEAKLGWVRYADNYLILGQQEEAVRAGEAAVAAFLRDSLHLRLNDNAEPVRSLDQGFVFLGIHFQGSGRTIAEDKMAKIKRRIEWTVAQKGAAEPAVLCAELAAMVEGWRRYYGFLQPAEQFARIEAWMESGLSELVSRRVAAEKWPRVPPPCTFPGFAGNAEENGKRLAVLWKKAVAAVIPATVTRAADKKVTRLRKRHQREQIESSQLLVTTPGHFVGMRGNRIVVRRKQTIICEMPAMRLDGLTLALHGVSLSTDVIRFCANRDIFINFVDHHGRVVAVTHKPDGVRAELAYLQARERDTDKGRQLARLFVTGKMKNQLALLKSYGKYPNHRDNGFGKALNEEMPGMNALLDKAARLEIAGDADGFRQKLIGLEGAFGARYWRIMAELLPAHLAFPGRTRQGADDLVNSLLNYGYGILYAQITNAVAKAGLNPQSGFLHAYQPGKPVLVYDLIEEFRATAVDRAVFSMLGRREALGQNKNGELSEQTRTKLAAAVLARLGAEVVHCGQQQTMSQVIDGQAMAVRRFLLGQGRYRPFRVRW